MPIGLSGLEAAAASAVGAPLATTDSRRDAPPVVTSQQACAVANITTNRSPTSSDEDIVTAAGSDIQYEKRATDQTVGHACDLTCNSDLL